MRTFAALKKKGTRFREMTIFRESEKNQKIANAKVQTTGHT